jgi:hypothetical protein
MLNAKEQESSGAELSDDAKARTHRAVEQYTDSALAKGRQMGVQQRAALGDVPQQINWRAWALKASSTLKYGKIDDAKHMCVI